MIEIILIIKKIKIIRIVMISKIIITTICSFIIIIIIIYEVVPPPATSDSWLAASLSWWLMMSSHAPFTATEGGEGQKDNGPGDRGVNKQTAGRQELDWPPRGAQCEYKYSGISTTVVLPLSY